MVAAFEAAIAKAIDYSKKPPEDFVDQASLAPRAPPQLTSPTLKPKPHRYRDPSPSNPESSFQREPVSVRRSPPTPAAE